MGYIWADVGSIWADVGIIRADVGSIWADVGIIRADVGRASGQTWGTSGQMWVHLGLPIWDPCKSRVQIPHGAHMVCPYGPIWVAHMGPTWDPFGSAGWACVRGRDPLFVHALNSVAFTKTSLVLLFCPQL